MIPWSTSDWSLSDLLRALGYTHRGVHCPRTGMPAREIMRGRQSYGSHNYDSARNWLVQSGQVES